MSEYQSVDQINELFKTGRLNDLPEFISIAGIQYSLHGSITHPFPDMLHRNLKAFTIYASTGHGKGMADYERLREEGVLDEWVVLIWAMAPNLDVVPARVAMNTAARASVDLETGTKALGEGQYAIVEDEEEILFKAFNRKVIGKVDTGANMSSIHAEHWKALPGNSRIEIQCSLLSPNKIVMNLKDQVVVKTSEGTEYRPVVEFDIVIKDKEVKKAAFNLNNRSGMQHARRTSDHSEQSWPVSSTTT